MEMRVGKREGRKRGEEREVVFYYIVVTVRML
jgi:hypothetical protein